MAQDGRNVPATDAIDLDSDDTDSNDYAIVVGFDYSDRTERALEVALEVAARRSPARLRVVSLMNSVVEEPHRGHEHSRALDALKRHLERRVQERALLGKSVPPGSRLDADVQFGPPAARLLAVAEALRADLVVVARTSRADQVHAGSRSVSDTVLMDAKCPVLVVTGEPK
jgi:nucleotide-binding universal stress UspA family protein